MILVETMLASSLFVGCAAIAVAVGAAGAKLVDTFGSKLGLYRSMPDSDPARVQIDVSGCNIEARQITLTLGSALAPDEWVNAG
jgi:hypothetical protein